MRKDAGSHYQLGSPADAQWTPVLATQLYYKTSWQAWRVTVVTSDHARQLSLGIKPDAPIDAVVSYSAHFVAR
jgi:hypothetical protein